MVCAIHQFGRACGLTLSGVRRLTSWDREACKWSPRRHARASHLLERTSASSYWMTCGTGRHNACMSAWIDGHSLHTPPTSGRDGCQGDARAARALLTHSPKEDSRSAHRREVLRRHPHSCASGLHIGFHRRSLATTFATLALPQSAQRFRAARRLTEPADLEVLWTICSSA